MKRPTDDVNKFVMGMAIARNASSKRRREEKRDKKQIRKHKLVVSEKIRMLRLRAKLDGITRVNVVFPEHFSIVDNTNVSMPVFTEIISRLLKRHPMYLDARNVSIITIDTLLYLLSLFNKFKWLEIEYSVMGKAPDGDLPRRIFTESGFYEYVSSNGRFKSGVDCVQIHTGVDANSEIAKNICIFAMSKLKMDRNETKGLYDIVMEIILNTIQHAFDRDKKHNKWYIYARFDEISSEIFFTILDTGYGIPTTARTKFSEVVERLINALLPGSTLVDARIIQSALNGDFRTQTGLGYRGKGIPRIAHYCNVGYISNLKIVSAHGYVSHQESKLEALPDGFHGTLYSWKMKKRA